MTEHPRPSTHPAPDDRHQPGLAGHHVVALVLVAPLLAALAVDWVITGVTGTRTFVTDDAAGPAWANTLTGLLLAAACLSLVIVLVRERALFSHASRWGRTLRACRAVLAVGLVALALGTSVVSPLLDALDVTSGPLYNASGLLALLALAATFGPALVIGLTQLRHSELGLGGRVLALAVPAIALTGLVVVAADDWASPVLFTMTVLGGVSVLGVHVHGAPAPRS